MPRFKRVTPGDRLRIPAPTWNAILDTTEFVQDARRSGAGPLELNDGLSRDVVLVLNSTGSALGVGGVVELAGLEITRDGNEASFLHGRPVFTGDTPSASDSGRFAVLIEPAANGKIARAVLAGQVAVLIDIDDESHLFADVQGSSSKLLSAPRGSAAILWKEDVADRATAGEAWCLVRLGNEPVGAPEWMVVQSSSAISGESYRWEYTLVEAEWNSTDKVLEEKVGGSTVTAYNARDMLNTSTLVDGIVRSTATRVLDPTAVPNDTPVIVLPFLDPSGEVPLFSTAYPLNPGCV